MNTFKNLFPFLLIIFISVNMNAQECVEGDCQNGFGKIVYQKYHHYTGSFNNGKYHGNGTLVEFKTTYKGEFKNGMMNGKGEMTIDIGGYKTLSGEWKDNKLEGRISSLVFRHTGIVEIVCNYKKGKKHGVEKTYKVNNSNKEQLLSETEYQNGQKNGFHKEYDGDGKLLYSGKFENNKRIK